jgi:hypothetical protein
MRLIPCIDKMTDSAEASVPTLVLMRIQSRTVFLSLESLVAIHALQYIGRSESMASGLLTEGTIERRDDAKPGPFT